MLLIDTLANGTAISYIQEASNTKTIHNWTKPILMENKSQYVGNYVEDNLCLDDDTNICVEKFGFFNIINSTNVNIPIQ
jgi:hypothetical protein